MRHLFLLLRPAHRRIALPKPLDCPSGCHYMTTWPDHAPSTWRESATITARTVKYMCGETFGKWPIGDIAFGIKYQMKHQGTIQQDYAGKGSLQLKGDETVSELMYLLNYLRLCFYFSKRPFPEFLQYGGYCQDNVLIQNSKARLLRPAFTIVCDEKSRSFLIIIRGATSARDRLTAATSGEVPFRHMNIQKGGVVNFVKGYAHCGMVAAARWIAKYAVPCLTKAKNQFPDYEIKVMGHSMGAGVAAILTHILRERKEFASSTCLAFAPAACMTWDLAESGQEFITSLINRNDVVPSFSKVSADNLRSEVVGSSWLDDVVGPIPLNKLFKAINQHMAFLQSCLVFMSSSRQEVRDDADFALCPQPIVSEATISSNSTSSLSAAVDERLQISSSFKNPIREFSSLSFTSSQKRPTNFTPKRPIKFNSYPSSKENKQLFPPGRIIHMVSLPDLGSKESIRVYENPRSLYAKVRLAPDMIKDHYMPSYIEMLELLIEDLTTKKE
ncbi:hypothetical protein LUZ61_007535 [Rhynchospora tenuis]|uniref:Fungal lipase-like domain-containing protein n=1 Tax=Rhynchospora tenuis TaxID=198213 RepID=A0AAD5ZTL5_9POAL|nr:hypothetical protein LUZ61_007535 [Rhynchospora tenuis]